LAIEVGSWKSRLGPFYCDRSKSVKNPTAKAQKRFLNEPFLCLAAAQKCAAKLTPADSHFLSGSGIYLSQEGFVNFDSASQSIIDSHFEHRSQGEKGEKQNRLGKGAASPNSQNPTERGIT
jgi:hypothetical protein